MFCLRKETKVNRDFVTLWISNDVDGDDDDDVCDGVSRPSFRFRCSPRDRRTGECSNLVENWNQVLNVPIPPFVSSRTLFHLRSSVVFPHTVSWIHLISIWMN